MALDELNVLFTASTARTYTSFLKDIDIPRALLDTSITEGKPNAIKALRAYVRAKHNKNDINLENVDPFFKKGLTAANQEHKHVVVPSDNEDDDEDNEDNEDDDELPVFTGEDEEPTSQQCPDCAFLKNTLRAMLPHLSDEAKSKLLQTFFDRMFRV